MSKAIEERLQNSLPRYFDSFREETINGVPFRIMPPQDKIPLIKRAGYDEKMDIFEIIFEYQDIASSKQSGNIVFIEDAIGRLIGIQIIGLKKNNVEAIALEVVTTLDDFIKAARVNLTKGSNPSDIGNIDLEERKLDFFKDSIRENLSQILPG